MGFPSQLREAVACGLDALKLDGPLDGHSLLSPLWGAPAMPVVTDPRVEAYIAAAAPFARAILTELRARIHAACPEATEAIKWGMPMFLYRGQLLANIAAFKAHASFGVMTRDAAAGAPRDGMGQFGKITTVAEIPDGATIATAIATATARIDAGVKLRTGYAPKPQLAMPDDLAAALDADPAARAKFDAFAPGQRREYIEWVIEAKRPETRASRIAQTVAQAAEGKTRNWKYANC
jgi:uncharacterized protein YdeI (YjbR/CyaY-like superfamily)